MTRPETHINQIVRAMRAQQSREHRAFIHEWDSRLEEKRFRWMRELDAPMRVLSEAYAQDLHSIKRSEPASLEWIQILELAQLLRAATSDLLLKLQPQLKTSLPISGPGPKTIADSAYKFLVDAGYQFGSSLGHLRKECSAGVQVVVQGGEAE